MLFGKEEYLRIRYPRTHIRCFLQEGVVKNVNTPERSRKDPRVCHLVGALYHHESSW